MPTYSYHCEKCGDFDHMHSIMIDRLEKCPHCNGEELTKLITNIGGFIFKGRAANQYNDIKLAKYWRDDNGVKHRVTESDGSTNCPTAQRSERKPQEEAEAISSRRVRRKARSKRRSQNSYGKFIRDVNKNK